MTSVTDRWTAPARAAVAELLRLRGRSIILTPATGVAIDKPGGGKDYAAATSRDAQTFALFKLDAEPEQGEARSFRYRLVGWFDAAIALGDAWEDDVAKYTVESIDRTKPYQLSAEVAGYLKVEGHSFG
ncbi:hypothetical protein ABW16_21550 [Mycolicibacter heraklionensis]|uniref:Pyridoxamine 5'-phosphate oxidase n=1 Tax=Mycolicibacter heraklionensis TaxID=512402 RepID=A0ABR5FA29_9MYCO|nr:hypothetical protein [Mycolicibacter heraklionensis]KLO25899.1 hypothetical protein ABW16_21550 [Mycolicibacter heraklionensis]